MASASPKQLPSPYAEVWEHFAYRLGLLPDLLPVVVDPQAQISSASKLRSTGKTPSRFNSSGDVVGIKDWTSHVATAADVARWSAEPRYGVCLQTRIVRGIDIDIDHPQAQEIEDFIAKHLGVSLPCRGRSNSLKRLLPLKVSGEIPKRWFKTAHGLVELLGNGQQCVIAGVHPSGEPYEWRDGFPNEIPELKLGELNELWDALVERFAIEPAHVLRSSKPRRPDIAIDDPRVSCLQANWETFGFGARGQLLIACPFKENHSMDSGDTECAYLPAGVGGYQRGHYKCFHASCSGRSDEEFDEAIGVGGWRDFEDLLKIRSEKTARVGGLPVEWGEEIQPQLNSNWLIKKTLPLVGLALIYGHSGSGKSFLAMDMALHVALGWPWKGAKAEKGIVVFVAAEGGRGFRNRVAAFKKHHGVEGVVPLALVPSPINLHDATADIERLAEVVAKAVERYGEQPALIVVDTVSKTMGAGKENTDDLAVYVANCEALAARFHCCIMPVHHRPKDATSSDPRGHSSLRAGVDTMILVEAGPPLRQARIAKQKEGEERHLAWFDLKSVTLGVDVDGEEVNSCVIELEEPRERPVLSNPKLDKARKLSPQQMIVWRQVGYLTNASPYWAHDVIPQRGLESESGFAVQVASLEALSDICISALKSGSDKKPDSARKAYQRALLKLQALELVDVCDGYVWEIQ